MEETCSECGEKFEYVDIRNKPSTCGRMVCKTNAKYREKHLNPLTGDRPTSDEVKKL